MYKVINYLSIYISICLAYALTISGKIEERKTENNNRNGYLWVFGDRVGIKTNFSLYSFLEVLDFVPSTHITYEKKV